MTAVQGIQVQSPGVVCWDKLGPDVILREAVVHAQILDPGCKALVKPQMGPPFLWRKAQDTQSEFDVQTLPE